MPIIKNNYIKRIENTLLKPDTRSEEILKFIEDSLKFPFYGVCIPPDFVSDVKRNFRDLKVISVVGFPFGYDPPQVKVQCAVQLANDGADEIDMVMNIARFLSKEYDKVEKDIIKVRNEIALPLKVIIECGILTKEEILKASKIVMNSGANFVKTSTGVVSRGATLEDVHLIRSVIKDAIGIKASGGIRNFKQMKDLVDAGAERIGTSKGIEIAKEKNLRGSFQIGR